MRQSGKYTNKSVIVISDGFASGGTIVGVAGVAECVVVAYSLSRQLAVFEKIGVYIVFSHSTLHRVCDENCSIASFQT